MAEEDKEDPEAVSNIKSGYLAFVSSSLQREYSSKYPTQSDPSSEARCGSVKGMNSSFAQS